MSEPALAVGSPDQGLVRFGTFELDLERGALRRRGGGLLRLAPQPLTVLTLLAGRAGELVTRDELRRAVWGDGVHVDFERGLASCVRQVREILDDSAAHPRFVETLPRRGYRFLAPVERVARPRLAAVAPFRQATPPAAPPVEDPAGVESTAPAVAPRRRPASWLAAGAVAAGLALTVAVLALRPAPPAPVLDGRVRLAVVPFEADDAGLGAGFTEEIVSRLAALDPDRLGVLAHTSVAALAGQGKTASAIAAELDATLLLEGGVRREGDRLRITARLIDVRDQTPRWSLALERPAGDLFAVEEELAERVAGSLALRLDPQRLAASPSAEAQEAYLRGRALMAAGTGDRLADAEAALDRAVALEPGHAAAWAAKAELAALGAFGGGSWRPAEAAARVEPAAERALALDPTQAPAELARAVAAFYFRRDLPAAGAAFERALALRPGMPRIRHWYAGWLSAAGRHAEALRMMADAESLDPLSIPVLADVGWFSFFAGDRVAAERACGRIAAIAPSSPAGWGCLAEVRRAAGDLAGSWAAERRRLAILGETETELAALDGLPLAEALRSADERAVDRARRAPGGASGVFAAAASLRLGRRDEALGWLETGVDAFDPWALFLRVDPRFDSLRDDLRFVALVERALGPA